MLNLCGWHEEVTKYHHDKCCQNSLILGGHGMQSKPLSLAVNYVFSPWELMCHTYSYVQSDHLFACCP